MKGEIDSSSFPSGGIRSLFEARGFIFFFDLNDFSLSLFLLTVLLPSIFFLFQAIQSGI